MAPAAATRSARRRRAQDIYLSIDAATFAEHESNRGLKGRRHLRGEGEQFVCYGGFKSVMLHFAVSLADAIDHCGEGRLLAAIRASADWRDLISMGAVLDNAGVFRRLPSEADSCPTGAAGHACRSTNAARARLIVDRRKAFRSAGSGLTR